MGLFSHTKQKDKLMKYLQEKNISPIEKNGKIEIEILFKDKGFSLFPYFIIDEANNYFSMIINIRKIDKRNSDLLEKINEFNLVSQYFSMKISTDNVIYLEYNTLFDDNIRDIFDELCRSLNELREAIDSI